MTLRAATRDASEIALSWATASCKLTRASWPTKEEVRIGRTNKKKTDLHCSDEKTNGRRLDMILSICVLVKVWSQNFPFSFPELQATH